MILLLGRLKVQALSKSFRPEHILISKNTILYYERRSGTIFPPARRRENAFPAAASPELERGDKLNAIFERNEIGLYSKWEVGHHTSWDEQNWRCTFCKGCTPEDAYRIENMRFCFQRRGRTPHIPQWAKCRMLLLPHWKSQASGRSAELRISYKGATADFIPKPSLAPHSCNEQNRSPETQRGLKAQHFSLGNKIRLNF